MEQVTGVKVTAVTDQPAFVEPFKPIEGPTVWYGGDLAAQVDAHMMCLPFSGFDFI